MSAFPSRFLALLAVFLVPLPPLGAQMTPGAPVKHFRLPRFAENGYTQWVLQGGQGVYESEERIRVEEMALRVYSADERMALEMVMESPEAALLVKQNRAVSKADLRVSGTNFDLSGTGWRWDGETKVIEVDQEVEVRFSDDLRDAIGRGEAGTETVIRSTSLRLQTTDEDFRFIFSGDVEAVSGDMTIRGEALLVFANAAGRVGEATRLEAIERLLARRDVVIERGGVVAYAGEAEFLPDASRAELRVFPRIELPGARVSGNTITLKRGHAAVAGGSPAGRARTLLSRAGELGLGGSDAIESETEILADTTVMDVIEEAPGGYLFRFEGSVELSSGQVELVSDTLEVESSGAADLDGESDSVEPVSVRRAIARGGVRIERDKLIATGEEALFLPQEERSVLSGDPRVEGEGSVVEAQQLELLPGGAKATSLESEARVHVTLPPLPDLGYSVAAMPESGPQPAEASVRPPRETTVLSRTARLYDEEAGQRFVFTEAVEVAATNLDASCDRLVVSTVESAEGAAGGMAEALDIREIEATGSVHVRQEGRIANAQRALILPDEGRLLLEGDASVDDERGRASGERLTLLQGERRALVEGNREAGERARISLPAPRE